MTWFSMTHISTKHWILDGFPRTLRQGELLDQHLKQVLTIHSVSAHNSLLAENEIRP